MPVRPVNGARDPWVSSPVCGTPVLVLGGWGTHQSGERPPGHFRGGQGESRCSGAAPVVGGA